MDIFDGDADSQTVEYEPVGVKDLLIAMKDSSELIVDLAYSAVLHNSEELAEEVLALESQMDLLQMQARMNMLMAARNTTDAKQLAPVLGMVGAAEKISEAAGDIAHIVLGEEQLPGAIRTALPEAMEVLERAVVDVDSPYAGHSLGEIDLETETGVRVIAVRGAGEWVLNPDRDTVLETDDVLMLRGAEHNLSAVYETVTGEAYEEPEEVEHDIADLARAVDSIVLMKNVSELSVDLAYGSVLYDDEELAEEVHALEVEVDGLHSRLEVWTLRAATEVEDPVSLRGLLRLANSTEMISDAALEITEGILRDIDTHPVIAESVRESDLAIRRARVEPGSVLDGATVATADEKTSGISIIAIHGSDDRWVFYPDADDRIEANDVLIARGTWIATEDLMDVASA
jgi:uncharacterized protein with PhoU and TrkA domain